MSQTAATATCTTTEVNIDAHVTGIQIPDCLGVTAKIGEDRGLDNVAGLPVEGAEMACLESECVASEGGVSGGELDGGAGVRKDVAGGGAGDALRREPVPGGAGRPRLKDRENLRRTREKRQRNHELALEMQKKKIADLVTKVPGMMELIRERLPPGK